MEHDAMDDDSGNDVCTAVVRRFRNSKAPEHCHLCAIALAISEILREQSLSPSPTACFAAAMSSLEKQMRTTPRDLAVTTAMCTFLSMVLPKVPPQVVRSKSDQTLQLLVDVLSADASVASTVKTTLVCVESTLRVADKSNWQSLARAFHLVLQRCVDQRPKVRKRAQLCMTGILSAFRGSPALSPASEAIVSSLEQSLKSVIGSASGRTSEKSAPGKPGAVEVLHMLGGLTGMLPLMSGKTIGRVLPVLANLVEMKQPLLIRRILDTLQALCMSPSAEIPPDVLGDVLGNLASFFSNTKKKDVDEIPVATRVIQHGFERLYNLDTASCARKLPVVFNALTGLLAAEQEEIIYGAAECLRSLVVSCVDDAMVQEGVRRLRQPGQGGPFAIERICVSAESMLGYQYSPAWDMSLHVISALFDKLGASSYVLLASTVKTLGDLQALPDQDLTCRKQLHKTLGAALGAMGPDQFLALLPLDMDKSDLGSSRIWLLPILKQHMVGARLGFFADHLLPLANQLRKRAGKLTADGKPIAARNAEACVQSLWALLPSVCNYPSDTAAKFGFLAKTLGDALNTEVELRGLICCSLQILILQNRVARGDKLEGKKELKAIEEMNSGDLNAAEEMARAAYTADVASANLVAIAGYSRNFLPLLFNIFLASPAAKRGDLQDTIASIASISDGQTVKSFFIGIMKKLLQATKEAATPKVKQDVMEVDSTNSEESATSRRCVFMDLALSLITGLDEEALGMLLTTAIPALQDKDGAVQKKAYKIISIICKENADFLAKNSERILETLMFSLASCHPSARRHRLSCVHYVVIFFSKTGDEKKDETIATLISEIILATKESNKKARNAAYDLLITIAHSVEELDMDNSNTNLMRYFNMILGCLAGTTPQMVSAAVASLARLIYEFASTLCHTVPDLLPSALLLLRSKNREVIKSVLGLVKVVIARLPAVDLEQHLSSMVQGLMLWTDDSKNRFKAKVREIIERMVRRCGMEAVAAVMPPEHMKLLTSIRKKKEQAEKKKKDYTDDDTKSVKSRATTARKSAWNHTDIFSDDLEGDDESEDEYGSTKATTVVAKSAMTKASNVNRSKVLRKSKKRLPEDVDMQDGEPLDLLDVKKTREVLSAVRKPKQADSDDEPDFDMDGRLIVDENKDRNRKRARNNSDDDDEDDDTKSRGGRSSANRRSQGKDSTKGTRPGQKEIAGRKKAKTGTKSWAYTGEDYANRKGKGGGDMKKEGKFEPYAYWPLDPKLLNRREAKKAAARQGMSSVLKNGKQKQGGRGSKAASSKSRKGAKVHKGKGKH
ncbi:unnamed protein product [Calypogeia fissa]